MVGECDTRTAILSNTVEVRHLTQTNRRPAPRGKQEHSAERFKDANERPTAQRGANGSSPCGPSVILHTADDDAADANNAASEITRTSEEPTVKVLRLRQTRNPQTHTGAKGAIINLEYRRLSLNSTTWDGRQCDEETHAAARPPIDKPFNKCAISAKPNHHRD